MKVSVSVGVTVNIDAIKRDFVRLGVTFADIDTDGDLNEQLKQAKEIASAALDESWKTLANRFEALIGTK